MRSRNKTALSRHGEPEEPTTSMPAQRRPFRAPLNRQVVTADENGSGAFRVGDTTAGTTATGDDLSVRRLNVMRSGYAFMAVGLAIVKWPLLMDARSVPVMEGVVTSLLTAMSLLAFLGLKCPVRMLPVLLFEVAWKVIWISAVGIPRLVSDDMNAATEEVLVNCSFVLLVAAVVPWGYVWRHYGRAPGDAWR